jgi:hypothetical protein
MDARAFVRVFEFTLHAPAEEAWMCLDQSRDTRDISRGESLSVILEVRDDVVLDGI